MAAKPNLNQTHLKPIFDYLDILCEQDLTKLDTDVLFEELDKASDVVKVKLEALMANINTAVNQLKTQYETIVKPQIEAADLIGFIFGHKFDIPHLNHKSFNMQNLGLTKHYCFKYYFLTDEQVNDIAQTHYQKIQLIRDLYGKIKANIVLTDDLGKIKSILAGYNIDITLSMTGNSPMSIMEKEILNRKTLAANILDTVPDAPITQYYIDDIEEIPEEPTSFLEEIKPSPVVDRALVELVEDIPVPKGVLMPRPPMKLTSNNGLTLKRTIGFTNS